MQKKCFNKVQESTLADTLLITLLLEYISVQVQPVRDLSNFLQTACPPSTFNIFEP